MVDFHQYLFIYLSVFLYLLFFMFLIIYQFWFSFYGTIYIFLPTTATWFNNNKNIYNFTLCMQASFFHQLGDWKIL